MVSTMRSSSRQPASSASVSGSHQDRADAGAVAACAGTGALGIEIPLRARMPKPSSRRSPTPRRRTACVPNVPSRARSAAAARYRSAATRSSRMASSGCAGFVATPDGTEMVADELRGNPGRRNDPWPPAGADAARQRAPILSSKSSPARRNAARQPDHRRHPSAGAVWRARGGHPCRWRNALRLSAARHRPGLRSGAAAGSGRTIARLSPGGLHQPERSRHSVPALLARGAWPATLLPAAVGQGTSRGAGRAWRPGRHCPRPSASIPRHCSNCRNCSAQRSSVGAGDLPRRWRPRTAG